MTFNLASLFESVADAVPDRLALVCGDRRLTYRQLDERANRLAHYFQSRGLGQGDHIGLHLHNGAEFVEAMVAALKIRAVPININYRYVEAELRYLFDNADIKALVHQRRFGPLARAAAAGLDALTTLVAVDDDSDAPHPVADSIDFEEALASGAPTRDFAPRSGDDLFIIYTGGTTGMPRGVMWRQEDIFFAGLQGGNPGDDPISAPGELAELIRGGREPLHVHPAAPLIHGAAQFATWIGFFTGGTVGLVPGRSFDPRATCALVAGEGMQVINLVGDAMARPLVDELAASDWDMSSLFALSSAGAILSAVVKEELERLLPDAMILNNFGASETGHQGTALASADGGRPRFIMIGDNSAVFDADLRPVSQGSGTIGKLGRTGRIPWGYYNDPEKTAATFFTDADGVRWVLPGDLATWEEDGTITLLGRGAVCINTGGEKVFPEEVEEAFKSHPAVLDAVVVGVPDPRWGERVTALVQLRPQATAELDALAAHCRDKVAGYKVPRDLHVVEAIDRHPSGKPDYRWALETARSLSRTAADGEASSQSSQQQIHSFWKWAAEDPERVAIIEPDGREVRAGELLAAANQLVHGLRDLGLQKGDSIATVLHNCSAMLELTLAATQAGWTIAPINWHLTADEIAYIARDCGARALFCSARFTETCRVAANAAELPPSARFSVGAIPGFAPYDGLKADRPTQAPDERAAGGPMNYTSGTTGRPKGVRRTMASTDPDAVATGAALFLSLFDIYPGTPGVHLNVAPLYHTAPLQFSVSHLHLGHTVVLTDKWTPEGALQRIERHGVTNSHMVPTQFIRLLKLPDEVRARYDLSSLKQVIHSAAPCPVDVKHAMLDWWGPCIYEYYAASEGGGTLAKPDDWLKKPGTVGSPWPISQVRILDDDHQPCPPGEVGTVWMRMGDFEFEYHKDQAKTDEAWRDGLFTVGDAGYLDKDGFLFLCDRKADMIISGGVNIYPAEIEAVLVTHPKVVDVAVFGVPDDDWGEQVKAVVEPAPDVEPGEALATELLAFAREKLAKYKLPRSVDFAERLPRDPNGKLYKRKLRDPYWAGRDRAI